MTGVPHAIASKLVVGKLSSHVGFRSIFAAEYNAMSSFMFCVHKIKSKYLNLDFVTMRNGGASTNGFHSHRLLLQEDTRACRENGIYSNQFLMALKYLYKLFEFKI